MCVNNPLSRLQLRSQMHLHSFAAAIDANYALSIRGKRAAEKTLKQLSIVNEINIFKDNFCIE